MWQLREEHFSSGPFSQLAQAVPSRSLAHPQTPPAPNDEARQCAPEPACSAAVATLMSHWAEPMPLHACPVDTPQKSHGEQCSPIADSRSGLPQPGVNSAALDFSAETGRGPQSVMPDQPLCAEPATQNEPPQTAHESGWQRLWRGLRAGARSGLDTAAHTASMAGEQISRGLSWTGGQAQAGWQAASSELAQVQQDVGSAIRQEGLARVFLDPWGARDRQHAQRELADRFQVLPPDFVGPRLPNQVDEKEYAQVAEIYSDIRLGRGDLTIDASAHKAPEERRAYQQGTLRDIAALMQTAGGRHLVGALHDNTLRDEAGQERHGLFGTPLLFGTSIHRQTTLVPLLRADGSPETDNGYAEADRPGEARQVRGDQSLGAAGPGSDVHIRYNPGVGIGRAYPTLTPTNPWLAEMRSDILLSHEMNHALRQTQGLVDARPVRATDNPQNPSDTAMAYDASTADQNGKPLRRVEHQAVGLGLYADQDMTENRYRAERRDLATWQGRGQLPGDPTLHRRDAYTPRTGPVAPAPLPAPMIPVRK